MSIARQSRPVSTQKRASQAERSRPKARAEPAESDSEADEKAELLAMLERQCAGFLGMEPPAKRRRLSVEADELVDGSGSEVEDWQGFESGSEEEAEDDSMCMEGEHSSL